MNLPSTEVLTGLNQTIVRLESQITIDKAKIKEEAIPLEELNAKVVKLNKEWKAKNKAALELKEKIKLQQEALVELLNEENLANKTRVATQDSLEAKRETMIALQTRVKANTVQVSKLKEQIETATQLKNSVSNSLQGLDAESAASIILDLAKEFNVSIPSNNGYDDSFFDSDDGLIDLGESEPVDYFPLTDDEDSFDGLEDPGLENDNETKKGFIG